MIDNWRELFYVFGFVPYLLFSARSIQQWLMSEKNKRSYVDPLFWKLSLTGNLCLLIHSFIQIQFHICAIQVINAVISWRNLNLMQPKSQQVTLQTIVVFFVSGIAILTTAFCLQAYLMDHPQWFRITTSPWHQGEKASFFWHFLGTFGMILFSSRFWIQWWCAEKSQKSYLGPVFWWLSLSGEILSLLYFIRIFDPVHILAPALGLIPCIRNLMLIAKEKKPSLIKPKASL